MMPILATVPQVMGQVLCSSCCTSSPLLSQFLSLPFPKQPVVMQQQADLAYL